MAIITARDLNKSNKITLLNNKRIKMNTRYFSDVKLYLQEKIKEYFIKLIIVQIFIGLVLVVVICFN